MLLIVAAPAVLAYCVSAPEEMLTASEPSDCPSTTTPGMLMAEPVGDDSAPLD